MTGRPSSFTQEKADAICERIAGGESLRSICREEGAPNFTTVMRWLGDPELVDFRNQYARAREAQADFMAEEILSIADDGRNDSYTDDEGRQRTDQDVIARSRLRVEARKWLASKMAPKKYGERVTQELTGDLNTNVNHSGSIEHLGLPEVGERIAELLGAGAKADSSPPV